MIKIIELKKNDTILVAIEEVEAIATFNYITSEEVDGDTRDMLNVTFNDVELAKVSFAITDNNSFINEEEFVKVVK
jgi:hypothetical protein